jgi:uncharacterized protein YdeI (YjbR/CyaY-like superfamily)
MPEITKTFFAVDRQRWRDWLARHHASRTEIWLLLNKKHVGEPCVSYDEAVEEALCFGWIDGLVKRVDERQYAIRFTPRKPRSVWSESNKRRVKRLIRAGRMTAAGLALVQAAKDSGEWDRATQRERTTEVPADLEAALRRNGRARQNFHGLAPSHRKMYIAWIVDAKREKTRQRRIREVVARAARNLKPGS